MTDDLQVFTGKTGPADAITRENGGVYWGIDTYDGEILIVGDKETHDLLRERFIGEDMWAGSVRMLALDPEDAREYYHDAWAQWYFWQLGRDDWEEANMKRYNQLLNGEIEGYC